MCKVLFTRNNLLILVVCVVVLSFWGCVTPGFFSVVENNKKVEVFSSRVDTIPNKGAVDVSEYWLPKIAKVEEIDYNDPLQSILIKYSEGEKGGFLFYNIGEKRIVWTANSNLSFNLMQQGNLVLREGANGKLFDTFTGTYIRNTESYLYFLSTGKTLILSPDTFALIDVRTGKRIWKQQGHTWEGVREVFEQGEWVYVIAEGLHALNLETGMKWEYLAPNSWKNVGKEFARQAALSCLAAAGGGYNYSTYQPDITMNMNSRPLVVGNTIFFAARDKMVCLDKITGKLIWEIKIDPELERMDLYDVSETEVALVGAGMKIVNYGLSLSDPPTIRLIRKDDGKIMSFYKMEKSTIVQSFHTTKENYFLLTPGQLFVFNKDLKLLSINEAKKEYGNFIGLLTATDTLVVRTSKGLAAVTSDSFKELWFQYCEVIPTGNYNDAIRPYFEKTKINDNSFLKYDYYWTPNETNGITAFDLKTGTVIMKLALFGKHMKQYHEQKVFDFDENEIKIISFK